MNGLLFFLHMPFLHYCTLYTFLLVWYMYVCIIPVCISVYLDVFICVYVVYSAPFCINSGSCKSLVLVHELFSDNELNPKMNFKFNFQQVYIAYYNIVFM